MTDPKPYHPTAPLPGNPPESPATGPIPLATVLSYEHRTPGQDFRSRGWLITAGILWILFGFAPLLMGLTLLSVAGSASSGTGNQGARQANSMVSGAMLQAGGIMSMVIGICCLVGRRAIVYLAPAWSILLLMGEGILLAILISILASISSLYGFAAALHDAKSLFLFWLIPTAILCLLCYIHVRPGTQAHLLAHDPRPSKLATKPTLTLLLSMAALITGGIAFTGVATHVLNSKGPIHPSRWFVLRLIVLTLLSPVLAGLTFHQRPRSSLCLGITYYALWSLAIGWEGLSYINDEAIVPLAALLLAWILCVLHYFNRSQSTSHLPGRPWP